MSYTRIHCLSLPPPPHKSPFSSYSPPHLPGKALASASLTSRSFHPPPPLHTHTHTYRYVFYRFTHTRTHHVPPTTWMHAFVYSHTHTPARGSCQKSRTCQSGWWPGKKKREGEKIYIYIMIWYHMLYICSDLCIYSDIIICRCIYIMISKSTCINMYVTKITYVMKS